MTALSPPEASCRGNGGMYGNGGMCGEKDVQAAAAWLAGQSYTSQEQRTQGGMSRAQAARKQRACVARGSE